MCGLRSTMRFGCNSPKIWETVRWTTSLLSALQPADVKEAVEATQGNPVARTRLHFIHAVALMIFDLDPVDVGTPTVPASSGCESRTKEARTDTGLNLKVQVSSILDQSSDREAERWSREELNLLRSRYMSVEGEDPMKSEEVTDDQLSVLGALTRVGSRHVPTSACGNHLASAQQRTSSSPSHFLDEKKKARKCPYKKKI